MTKSKPARAAWLSISAAVLTATACSSSDAKLIKNAETAISNGDYAVAAKLYAQVSDERFSDRNKAKNGIDKLATVSKLQDASTKDFADILEAYNSFNRDGSTEAIQEVYNIAVERIKSEKTNEVSSHALLHAAQALGVEKQQDLSQLDFQLITAINKSDPANIEAASELGEIYYSQGDIESAKNALLPVVAHLDDSEGARILGEIFIAEGNNQNAYPLLKAYTASRLARFQNAEKHFGDLQTELWDNQFEKLNAGDGPQSFYDAYDAASDQEKQLVVDNYISEQIGGNSAYSAALEEYREAAAIVPVVMDFGILQLKNAETMTSESERNAELNAAEETFLSIRSVAGEADDYKIYLGQVYFWLGKQTEGMTLFNEVIDISNRDPMALLNVSSTLRDLGKVGLAKDLAQEAYENTQDDDVKGFAVNMMQHLATTLEDKIKWLERADLESPFVKSSLLDNRGHLAAQRGRNNEAAEYYREAINLMESQPESAANYNNTALSYFSLYRVTGDRGAYGKGVDLMSKAVELAPDQPIMLSNAASSLVVNSFYETLDDQIDYDFLKINPSFDTVQFYYSNETEKSKLRENLRKHSDMIKAIDYFERSILLSPNSVDNYTELQHIYYFLNDTEAMKSLAVKISENQVDVSAGEQSYADFITGKNMETDLIKIQEKEKHIEAQLKSRNISPQTKAVLHRNLSENLIAQSFYQVTGFAEKALAHAEKSYEIMPSSATKSALGTALLTAASVQAADKFPTYKTMKEEIDRSIPHQELISLAMNRDDEIGAWLRNHEFVKRAVKIEVEDFAAYPHLATPSSWAILQHAENKSLVDQMVERIKNNELMRASRDISRVSAPYATANIINDYRLGMIDGTTRIDQERLERLLSMGASLPPEILE